MRRPALVLAAALFACASVPARAREAPAGSGPYTLELVDPSGRSLATFEHRGRTWVLGRLGERYLLRFRNGSGRRVEVVASVDGRDVVDGRPAAFEKRGYVVSPWGEVTIDGFRLSRDAVAAFRFSRVPDSYAARMGDARNVGVVGLAVFPERERRLAPPRPLGPGRGEPGAPEADTGSDRAAASAEEKSSDSGARPQAHLRPRERPGLGTAFGERHGSPVESVAFERESERPAAVLTLRYDDARGLAAQGIDVYRGWAWRDEAWRRRTARPFPAEFAAPPPGWKDDD